MCTNTVCWKSIKCLVGSRMVTRACCTWSGHMSINSASVLSFAFSPHSPVLLLNFLFPASPSVLLLTCSRNHTWSTRFDVSLTMVLLNPDLHSHCKQCRSRSVGFFKLVSEEANWSGSALFAIKYVNLDQQSGLGDLIGWKLEVVVAS